MPQGRWQTQVYYEGQLFHCGHSEVAEECARIFAVCMKLLEQVATSSLPLHHCYYYEWYIVVTATGTEPREIVSGRHDHIDNHDASASCVPVTRCPPQLRKSGQLLYFILYTLYFILYTLYLMLSLASTTLLR